MARKKHVSVIAAVAENGVIGLDNKLPWRIKGDMERFKKTTMGNTVVMGRKTYESLPNGALQGRENIVITRRKNFNAPGCIVVHSLDDAIKIAKKNVFIIGGAEIYKKTLPIADYLYITIIRGTPDGDTFFPFHNGSQKNSYGPYGMPPGWIMSYWEERRSTHEEEFDCIYTEWYRKK
jgi:dihydrofolate reductase